jgi:preprotein translocase subunit SecE
MADEVDKQVRPEEPGEEQPLETAAPLARVGADVEQGAAPTQLGATRYVLAGFFAAAIAVAYVVGRVLTTGWNRIADSQWAIDKAPWLTQMTEESRATWGTAAGALVGIGALVYVYRREDIRSWVNDAAAELAKVTWPSKKDVTNSTITVVVASVVATIYLALLDRFWGFVTNLVYGV